MFTVKHVDSKGNEFAIEAKSFEVTTDGGLFRLMTYDEPYRGGSYKGLWVGKGHEIGLPETDAIYVMNRFGSTIAKYHFCAEQESDRQRVA